MALTETQKSKLEDIKSNFNGKTKYFIEEEVNFDGRKRANLYKKVIAQMMNSFAEIAEWASEADHDNTLTQEQIQKFDEIQNSLLFELKKFIAEEIPVKNRNKLSSQLRVIAQMTEVLKLLCVWANGNEKFLPAHLRQKTN